MLELKCCDEEDIVKMTKSKYEALLCAAKEEGYSLAKKQEYRAESIIKILEGLTEILKG